MILEDDRTPEQKKTHNVIVLMTDRFLSGWGGAGRGPSYAGWACRYEDLDTVERWVRRRGDALRVRIVRGNYRPPAREGHCHIYVVKDGHPAHGEQRELVCESCGSRAIREG